MRQQSFLVESDAPKHPCAVCGDAATHVATYSRPGNDPAGGTRHGVGWLEHKELCEAHASRAVSSDEPPWRLRRLDPVPKKSPPESLTLWPT